MGKLSLYSVLFILFAFTVINAKSKLGFEVQGDGFKNARKTAIFIHSSISDVSQKATFLNTKNWNKMGYNTVVYHWEDAAFEDFSCHYFQLSYNCVNSAERRIWGVGWHVGDRILRDYKKFFSEKGAYNKEVRVIGHGLGGQLGVYLLYMLYEQRWTHGVIPGRIELLDPYVKRTRYEDVEKMPIDATYWVPAYKTQLNSADCSHKNFFNLDCVLQNSLYSLYNDHSVGIAVYASVMTKGTLEDLKSFLNYREFKSHSLCERSLWGSDIECDASSETYSIDLVRAEHFIPVFAYFWSINGLDSKYEIPISAKTPTKAYLARYIWIKKEDVSDEAPKTSNELPYKVHMVRYNPQSKPAFGELLVSHGWSEENARKAVKYVDFIEKKYFIVTEKLGMKFDPRYYLSRYPALKKKFKDDYEAATRHWITKGIYEGKKGYEPFDVKYYLAKNPKLATTFKKNHKSATRHWYDYGMWENRKAYERFDAGYYLAKHPAVKKVYGPTNRAALKHWYDHGITEGRVGSVDFNPHRYMLFNQKVKTFCKFNPYCALAHWYTIGIKENYAYDFKGYIGSVDKGTEKVFYQNGSHCVFHNTEAWSALTNNYKIPYEKWMDLGKYTGLCNLKNLYFGNIQKNDKFFHYHDGRHCAFEGWEVLDVVSESTYISYESWMDMGKFEGQCNLKGIFEGNIKDVKSGRLYYYSDGSYCEYKSMSELEIFSDEKTVELKEWMDLGKFEGPCI